MIGNPGRLVSIDELLKVVEIVGTQGIDAAKIHRNSVEHDRGDLAHTLENPQRTTSRNHEILGDDLEPVGARASIKDLAKMRCAKTESVTDVRKHWHLMKRWRRAAS